MPKQYEWDIIKLAAELTRAALSSAEAGKPALDYPEKAATLLQTLTERIHLLAHGTDTGPR